ncbi:ComEC/Rec2 family competence protein [Candidatus Gottesmanbacteria bacterium]|nr:ComEC/Rec2 family competence protein [Candidatus Gottesmanbacteria bacterium]
MKWFLVILVAITIIWALPAPSSNIFSLQTNKLLPEPQASLLNGILWGEKARMPKDFYEALRRTGTLHVVALSGMNITILVNLLGKITLFLGRKKSILTSLLLIVVFIWFVGAPPSVIRAGIMGTLSLLAVWFGRRDWSLLSLVLAAGTMLMVNFSWLTNIGFQLSFLATLGIILFGGVIPREKGAIGEIKYQFKTDLRTTLAAQIFTLPVILYNFKQLSLIAPLTNVAVLWIVQPIMVLGFILSLLAIIYTPLAVPVAWIIWVPLTYFIEVVKLTAKLPFAQISF